VAWADQDATRQRVYVRDMSSGTRWLAADLPRCVGGRCYRIDAVGLADQGVVFVRGAIGPQPSFIVRRGFSDAKATRLAVPNDPQPDLAPSSVGALYYAFGRGWYRWDFGRPDTRLTRFRGARQTPVLLNEGDDWFVRVDAQCKGGLQRAGARRHARRRLRRPPEPPALGRPTRDHMVAPRQVGRPRRAGVHGRHRLAAVPHLGEGVNATSDCLRERLDSSPWEARTALK